MLPSGAVDPRAVKRFLREAETVAALAHPGIVPIYGMGVHNGLYWFAMQRIDGCPLSQWFATATFGSRAATLREVVRIGIEAAEALEHAHQRGVIHRDVKNRKFTGRYERKSLANRLWISQTRCRRHSHGDRRDARHTSLHECRTDIGLR